MPEIYRQQLCVPPGHPCIPGHFPGDPIVPGVVLLDQIRSILQRWKPDCRITGLNHAKFHKPLIPGKTCDVILTGIRSESVRFVCALESVKIASGTFLIGNPN